MLMSSKGAVLRCDVHGKIVMKVFLSGMPDVKLGLNDKLEARRRPCGSRPGSRPWQPLRQRHATRC